MMTTQEVADKLVEMCRAGKVEEVKVDLFTEDTISVEPREGVLPLETKGLLAIQQKAELFISMVDEFHGNTISDPIVAGNYFSLVWDTDLKMKGSDREMMSELCVYEVRDDKILSERFFY